MADKGIGVGNCPDHAEYLGRGFEVDFIEEIK